MVVLWISLKLKALTFSVELFMDGAGLTSSTEHRARAKIADCVE